MWFSVKVDENIYARVKNSDPQKFANVKIYAGHWAYQTAAGKIRNLQVKTWN